MGALLPYLAPILIKAIASGQIIEIAGTAIKLVQLVLPLVEDASVKAALTGALTDLQTGAVSALQTVRPAQPEDPIMARR